MNEVVMSNFCRQGRHVDCRNRGKMKGVHPFVSRKEFNTWTEYQQKLTACSCPCGHTLTIQNVA